MRLLSHHASGDTWKAPPTAANSIEINMLEKYHIHLLDWFHVARITRKKKYRPSLTKLTGTDQMYNVIMRSPTIWLRTSLQNWRFMLQATQTWTYGTILNTERPIRRQNPQRLRQLLRQSDQIRLTRGHLHNSARAILEKARRVLVMISLCSQREFFWWWRRNSCGSEDGQSA